MELSRPVGVALSRQQVFETTMRRSESRQRVRLSADAQGHLTGIGHEAYVSNLPDEAFSEPVTQATPFIYSGENRLIGHHIARVNRTCAGSVRAPGESIGVTVLENAMDELACDLGIDPVDLRLANFLGPAVFFAQTGRGPDNWRQTFRLGRARSQARIAQRRRMADRDGHGIGGAGEYFERSARTGRIVT